MSVQGVWGGDSVHSLNSVDKACCMFYSLIRRDSLRLFSQKNKTKKKL